MIDFVRGKVMFIYPDSISVDCGHFGIKVFVPLKLISRIGEGDEVFLFTQVIIPPEGTPNIYGFESRDERHLFNLLLKIPKVGSRIAMSLLSHFSAEQIYGIVRAKDVDSLSLVPGLGRKLSERVIFELRSRIKAEESSEVREIVEALESLGYSKREVLRALEGMDVREMVVEDVIKEALRRLSGGKFGEGKP